jgi:hypothetical protein
MTRSHRNRRSQGPERTTRDHALRRHHTWSWALAIAAAVVLVVATALAWDADVDGRDAATLGPLRLASWAWPYLAVATASLAVLVPGVAVWRRTRAPRRDLPRARAVKPRR